MKAVSPHAVNFAQLSVPITYLLPPNTWKRSRCGL